MSSNKQRLDQTLVMRGLVETRTKAAAMIMAGLVKVDGQRVDKAGYFVKSDAQIDVEELPKYVSRGGDKIASVAQKLQLDFRGKIVMDVGSSTGGFTDYALQHGAQKVYAIDVGTGQLHYKLRKDPRVVLMERTDIRDVRELSDVIDVVVVDVSFISLKSVMPSIVRLITDQTIVAAMAKPHFEADYATASKYKGVIKNDTIRRGILKNVEESLKTWFVVLDKADSEVLGRKGNQERFFLLKKLEARF